MTVTIPIRVAGEIWFNANELRQSLAQITAQDQIILDLCLEAPCLHSIGLMDILQQHSIDPAAVTVIRWSNPVQQVPYHRLGCADRSYFFKYSKQYWQDSVTLDVAPRLFGIFLGRNTVARNTILYEINHTWPQHFLCSRMRARAPEPWLVSWPPDTVSLESLADWTTAPELQKMISWYQQDPVCSLDQKTTQDQYHIVEQSAAECNRSLLQHYDGFNIELVCETYAYGTTFFPTEKTVRPIMAAKPFVVYGPRDYLANLKKLGFETYHTCWDESYDLLEGPERWHAIKTVIQNLVDTDRTCVLTKAWDIACRNRAHLQHMVNT